RRPPGGGRRADATRVSFVPLPGMEGLIGVMRGISPGHRRTGSRPDDGRSRGPAGRPPRGTRLSQAEHVLHVEEPVLAPGEETAGAQGAMSVGDPARRPVRDLDALADAGEAHGMVAVDVAAADR